MGGRPQEVATESCPAGSAGGRWLVLSYFANINGLAASHHLDDRLPLLKARGIDVILLSSWCGRKNTSVHHTRVPSVSPSGIRYELRYFLRKHVRNRIWFRLCEGILMLPILPFYALEKAFFRLDSTTSWALPGGLAAVWLCRRYRPSLIYSTGGPYSAHFAAMFASRVTGIPYVVGFQDPLLHQCTTRNRAEHALAGRAERMFLGSARVSVFLTRTAAERARERYPGARVEHLYPGAPPAVAAARGGTGGVLTFAHFGSLAGNRDLECFLPALEKVLRARPALETTVRVHLYGATGRNVREQVARFGFPGVVTEFGKVGREEAQEAMGRADVLLLIQNRHEVSEETIPSKFYEYLHTGTMILGVPYRNPELRAMVEEGGGVGVEADDVGDIARGLQECVARWERGAGWAAGRASRYTTEAAVGRLVEMATAEGIRGVR